MDSSEHSTVRTLALAVALVLTVTIGSIATPVSAAVVTTGGHADGADTHVIGDAQLAGTDATPATFNGTGISNVTYGGAGIATRQGNTTYVWQDGHTTLDVTMHPLGSPGEHELCVALVAEGELVADHGCKTVDVESYGTVTTVDLPRLGTNRTGPHALVVELRDANDAGTNQTVRVPMFVVTRDGDVDADSLSNAEEVRLGTSIRESDTDSDGLMDGPEVNQYNSSATTADTDLDGARDGVEISEGTDPTDADTDNDGLTDGKEINRYGTSPTDPDTDGDGLSDGEEIKLGTDPLETDTDGDGTPDGEEVQRGTDPTIPTTPNGTGNASAGENAGGDEGGTSPLMRDVPLYVTVGALLVAGIAVVVYSRYGRREPDGAGSRATVSDGSGPAASPEVDDSETAAGAPGEALDPDLLSPEQYVDRLLERHGGKMKQSEIVEETDWSKAKVSRKLSKMEEEGLVERTRIGRGKIVKRADDPGEER